MFKSKIIIIVFIVTVLIYSLFGQEHRDNILSEFLESAVKNGKISGVHAIVSKDGKLVYSKTFGYSNLESNKLLDSNAIYRIASMTKIITTIAALKLWQKGCFNIDDPVSKHLPEFKKAVVLKGDKKKQFKPPYKTEPLKRQPTIKDLFRHTAGIWGGKRYTVAGLRDWKGTLDGFVEQLVSVPLDTQPGTRFQYGYSTDVLGLLVEKWSGKKLDEYLKKNIIEPLGLDDTSFVIPDEKLNRLCYHYEYQKGKLICKEKSESSPFRVRSTALSGGGGWDYSYPGLLTSADDWLIVMEMIRNGGIYNKTRILKQSTVNMMCSDHLGDIPGAFEKGAGYGFGVGVVIDEKAHGKGASNGTVYWAGAPHNTYFYIDFKKKISAAMFMQCGPFGIDDIMNKFLIHSQEVFGKDKKSPTVE